MQINPTSSILTANNSAQASAQSANTLINRIENLRSVDAHEQRVSERSNINRSGDNNSSGKTGDKSLIVRPINSQPRLSTYLNEEPGSDFLPVDKQQFRSSSARLVNPGNSNGIAFSRNAIIAYEATSRLDERSQIAEILGFDAFA